MFSSCCATDVSGFRAKDEWWASMGSVGDSVLIKILSTTVWKTLSFKMGLALIILTTLFLFE